jgi:carbon-monoxide dehydrogenase large subunit
MLEISPRDLQIDEGRISVRGLPERGLKLDEVAREAVRRGDRLAETTTFAPGHPSTWAGGANAAIVEVDVETGKVTILRYVVVHDSGTIVNPTIVEGQVHGGVAHGAGNALYERMVYGEDGQVLTGTFADYTLPGSGDVPTVEIIHMETPSPFNPEGIKGAGEGGTIGGIPTIVSAVEDALSPFGVQIDEMPLNPEVVVRLIEQAKSGVDRWG